MQWNMDPLKMYFLLNIGDIPASYVSLPDGSQESGIGLRDTGNDGPMATKWAVWTEKKVSKWLNCIYYTPQNLTWNLNMPTWKRKKKEKTSTNHQLGGGFKYFYFHPYLWKIPILTNVFQMGWNHQAVNLLVVHVYCSFSEVYSVQLIDVSNLSYICTMEPKWGPLFWMERANPSFERVQTQRPRPFPRVVVSASARGCQWKRIAPFCSGSRRSIGCNWIPPGGCELIGSMGREFLYIYLHEWLILYW